MHDEDLHACMRVRGLTCVHDPRVTKAEGSGLAVMHEPQKDGGKVG